MRVLAYAAIVASFLTAALIVATPVFAQCGTASWYGPGFHGKRTASGARFNQNAMTAAHRRLPFGTVLRVTNPRTNATVTVTINDRGPYHGNRVLDLSKAAASKLGIIAAGTGKVCWEVR